MIKKKNIVILCIILSIGLAVSLYIHNLAGQTIISNFINQPNSPVILVQKDTEDNNNGNGLSILQYSEGLSFPTSMTFVNNNTILVVEKNTGAVRVVSNGLLQQKPILKLNNIDNEAERGLLGIATLKNEVKNTNFNKDNRPYAPSTFNISQIGKSHPSSITNQSVMPNLKYSIFLYFTEKIPVKNTNNDDINTNSNKKDNKKSNFNGTDNYELRNRIYRYLWDGNPDNNITDPLLLIDLPAKLGPHHNGGKIKIGPDNQLYAVIGDLVTINNTLQNRPDASGNNSKTIPNNSSVILRVNPINGSYLKDNPFYKNYNNHSTLKSLIYYYTYGIRNSFGMDFDPLTGTLWDTENVEDQYDEINIVNPGFNSGWYKIMGPLSKNNGSDISDLILFNGSHYADPVLSWSKPIGITDIEFFKSSKFGKKYENNIFAGDINNGNIYFLKVNSTRNGIDMNPTGENDKNNNNKANFKFTIDNKSELDSIVFAKGFDGRITDIETGPDGYLYILTYFDGKIYRIEPQIKN